MNKSFVPGDEVYHASNPKLIMIVESIHDQRVYCSWIEQKTNKKREESFSIVSLRKVDNEPLYRVVEVLP